MIGDGNGQIKIYNQNSLVNSFQAHSNSIYRVKQSIFNTNYVATCSDDVKIWNVSSSFNWTLITTYSQHSSGVFAFEWLDSDTLASSGHYNDPIKICELESHGNLVDSIQYANNSARFLSGSKDGTARIWKYESQKWKTLVIDVSKTLKK